MPQQKTGGNKLGIVLLLSCLTLLAVCLVGVGIFLLLPKQSSEAISGQALTAQANCAYVNEAVNTLQETQEYFKKAKGHIGSATLLQDDIDRLSNVEKDFASQTAPPDVKDIKLTTSTAVLSAITLFQSFRDGFVSEELANRYLDNLESATTEIKQVRKDYNCP